MADKPVTERVDRLIRSAIHLDQVDVDADLIGTGVMDSLTLVALITDIEDDFDIELPLDDFDIEAFRSIRSIAAFVATAIPEDGGA